MLTTNALPRTGPVLFLCTVLAVAVGVAAAPGPATAASRVDCGQTVTRSVTLRADLHCGTDGLTIGADGVVLNLNGHVISGSGTGTGVIAAARTGLQIRNGVIRDFFRGVALEATSNTIVSDVRFIGNGAPDGSLGGGAVYADQVSGLLIRGGRMIGPIAVAGVRTEASTGVVIRGVDVTGQIDLSIDTPSALLVGNTFRGGNVTLSESNGTVVRGNTFSQAGLRISQSDDVAVLGNRMTGGTIQVANSSAGVLVRGNALRDSEFGLTVVPPAPGLRVTANTFSGHSYGIHLRPEFLTLVDGLEVTRNRFVANGHAGLFLESPVPGSGPARINLSGNRFVANGYASVETDAAGRQIDDGLHTNLPIGADVLVADNRTVDNAEFGIEALPAGSVRDGGGNVSDGDRRGCAGVVCR